MAADLAAEIVAMARVAEKIDERNKEFCHVLGEALLVDRLNKGWRIFEQRQQTTATARGLKTMTRHKPWESNGIFRLGDLLNSQRRCYECKQHVTVCKNQECCLIVDKTQEVIVEEKEDVSYILWKLKK